MRQGQLQPLLAPTKSAVVTSVMIAGLISFLTAILASGSHHVGSETVANVTALY